MNNEKAYMEKEIKQRKYHQSHGDRIREIRKRENLSQEKLAEMAEIDVSTLRKAENGDTLLPSAAAIKLYLELGYSLEWIYGISEVAKSCDDVFFVDIRDIVQIKDGKVDISIKSKYYEFLTQIEISGVIKELKLDEDYARLSVGMEKQRRRFFHFCNEESYYRASISTQEFKQKPKQNDN